MRTLFSGEHRRAAIMGAMGMPVIFALLMFRLFSGGDDDTFAPVGPAPPAVSVPPAGGPGLAAPATPAAPVPAPLPPIDPALLRDPFCPLVGDAATPESAPVGCPARTVPPGHQVVGLLDIFPEAGTRLARMHVGPFTFPNLREGDVVADMFRVVSLSERCGEFESAGEPFSMCVGEQTFK